LGNDTFEFGAAADSLGSLLSPIEVHGELGTDAVIIHDGSNTADAVWTITNFTVGRTGWAGMRYNTSESVTIDAGSGSETFNVESTHATAPLTINAAGGNDVARLAPTSKLLDDIVTPVTFNGQGGTDQVVMFDDADTFADTYTINATQRVPPVHRRRELRHGRRRHAQRRQRRRYDRPDRDRARRARFDHFECGR
jgi:hypothetical protein